MVRNGIRRVCFYFLLHGKKFRVVFSSAEWFGMEFRVVFSSAEGFGTELWEFASIFVPRNGIPSCFLFRGRVGNGIPRFSVRGTTGIPSEMTICSVYSVFRGINRLQDLGPIKGVVFSDVECATKNSKAC
jgi:hypothetical protein